MKRSIIFLYLVSMALSSSAQLSIGLSGGPNVSTMSVYLRDLSTFRIKPVFGYNANLIADYRFNSKLSLLSGISVTQKGFVQQINFRYSPNSDSTATITNKLVYLQVPVYLKFTSGFDKVDLFYAIGPFIAYGIQGKITTDITGRKNLAVTDIINWDKPRDFIKSELVKEYGYSGIKRFDFGLGSMIGLKSKNIILAVSYQYSLHNIMWEYYQDEKMSNSSLSFSIGYMIN
jgi:hypothetical protein